MQKYLYYLYKIIALFKKTFILSINKSIFLFCYLNENYRGFEGWIEGAEGKCKAGYGSPNSLEEAATMLADCKAWREMTDKVNTTLEAGKASADKMTLHEEQDKLYTEMRARWVEVDKSCKEWSVKLDELAGMWTKQTGESYLSEVIGWFVVNYFGHEGATSLFS